MCDCRTCRKQRIVKILLKKSLFNKDKKVGYLDGQTKEESISLVVDATMGAFAEGLVSRYSDEVDDINGVINMKKNNCFIAELGEEFMFYSAFVRSFDSSFGNVLEKMGNNIAKLSYDVRGNISSFILPDQTQRIATVLDNYVDRVTVPKVSHYAEYTSIYPRDVTSCKREHVTDNYFYSATKKRTLFD